MRKGDRFGKFEATALRPDGGQADVCVAKCRRNGDEVFLKRLKPGADGKFSEASLKRWQREASIGRIPSRHVVTATHAFQEGNDQFLVFPLIEGCTLKTYTERRGGRLILQEALAILRDVLTGLHAIHQRGIVHRDIKYTNIMMADGSYLTIIVDFGIAKVCSQQTITAAALGIGTDGWMAPEQQRDAASVDHRADLFAAGRLLQYMLAGEAALTAPAAQARTCIDSHACAAVPDAVHQYCETLTAEDPIHRFQSAQDAINKLDNLLIPTPADVVQKPATRRCLACGSTVNGQWQCSVCNASFGTVPHHLAVGLDENANSILLIPQERLLIGRGNLAPQDKHISSRHLIVHARNGTVTVEDAGSTNGTYLDGHRITGPVELSQGQTIRAGNQTFTYHT